MNQKSKIPYFRIKRMMGTARPTSEGSTTYYHRVGQRDTCETIAFSWDVTGRETDPMSGPGITKEDCAIRRPYLKQSVIHGLERWCNILMWHRPALASLLADGAVEEWLVLLVLLVYCEDANLSY